MFLYVILVKIILFDGRFVIIYGLLDNVFCGIVISGDVVKELGLKGYKEFIFVSMLM